jgi:hypothetical protein
MKSNRNSKETIHVIDSPLMALIVAVRAGTTPVRCIFELKSGIDEGAFNYLAAAEAILSGSNLEECTTVKVPSRYFTDIETRPLQRLRFLRHLNSQVNEVCKIEVNTTYVGPSTSTIMSCVAPSRRFYLDHGTGDYVRRLCSPGWARGSLQLLRSAVERLYGVHSSSVPLHAPGASLALLRDDNFEHIDVRRYRPPQQVTDLLRPLTALAGQAASATLLLPVSAWHSKAGFDGDSSKYDALNLKLAKLHCSTDHRLFVKFHPTLYRANDIKVTLIDALRMSGFDAFNVDDLLAERFRGHIPAELLTVICGIRTIVSEESSLLWNLAHLDGLGLIGDPALYDIPLGRAGRLIRLSNLLNKNIPKAITLITQ